MAVSRRRHCAVVFENHLYAIGGEKTVERYDFTAKRWENVVSLTAARSHCVGTALDGYIYVIGSDFVERLNPNTGSTEVRSFHFILFHFMIFGFD